MDSKGRWVENVFIKPLWRSVKCEDIYLMPYVSITKVKKGLPFFSRSTMKNDGQNFDRRTTAMIYFNTLKR